MTRKASVLVVDDEPDIRELLYITLSRMELDAETAANISEAKEKLAQGAFDLCLTDMNLPDGNGIDLVRHLQQVSPELPVAVITAYGSIDSAITALKAGAFDFVSKPVDLPRLRDLVKSAIKPKPSSPPEPAASGLLGKTSAMESLRAQIQKLARSQAPVFISGESGVGKERVARLIHESGNRADKPFIAVNCGAIPSELMESEFFGHRKGAFTGATEHKEGLFLAANGGTLFLDEVADLPLTMQVKLLRAIQEKAVRPVGESKEVPTDIRLLSATHKALATEVDEGRFRQDLYYRINVIELRVPPLRERADDIPLLAKVFLDRLCSDCGVEGVELSPEAIEKLKNYEFPGNVRELENLLERVFTLCDSQIIDAADIDLPGSGGPPGPGVTSDRGAQEGSDDAGFSPQPPRFDDANDWNLESYLESIEKQAIVNALEETRWNKTAAAKRLGISFRALRYRLKKLNME